MDILNGNTILYRFQYRKPKSFFWKKAMVSGHKYEKEQDKMCLFFADGSIFEIAKWSDCELRLGIDWVNAMKHSIEGESGR